MSRVEEDTIETFVYLFLGFAWYYGNISRKPQHAQITTDDFSEIIREEGAGRVTQGRSI